MGKYSKLIGMVVGSVLGILVALGLMPEDLNTPELQAAVVTVAGAIGTYFAPKNAD